MFAKIREIIDVWSKRLAWLPPTLVRLAMGITMWTSGWPKLVNLDATITNFRDTFGLPIPHILAPLTAGVEFLGGVLLLLGLATRFASLALAFNFVVAIATVIWKDLGDKLNVFGVVETCYVLMFIWLAVAGPGPISLDRLLSRKLARPAVTSGPSSATAGR
jgi:putative oxidoreductase